MQKLKLAALGFVGLSASTIAFLSIPQSAKAADINAGTDYAQTDPFGSTLVLTSTNVPSLIDPLVIPLQGVPINPGVSGVADTVINRYQDIDFGSSGIGTTNIQIVDLSLQSINPVNIGGINYTIFTGLQSYAFDPTGTNSPPASDGTLTVYQGNTTNPLSPPGYVLPTGAAGTWNSGFTIYGVAVLTPEGTQPTGNNFVRNLIENDCPNGIYTCVDFVKNFTFAFNGAWYTTPQSDQIIGPNLVNNEPTNFYIGSDIIHDAGDGTVHTVSGTAVPEPLTMLGSGAALGLGMMLKKRLKRKSK